MKKTIIIIAAIILVLAVFMGGSYNSLVSMNEDVLGKWSQVENQLQRRADLIPNLVATVKGYATHEEEIMKEVADSRSRLIGAGSVAEKAQADEELNSALSRLLAIAENYPNLKADANFRQLQDDLAGTENRIAVARKDYNESVQTYNANIKKFPTVIWASMFGFDPHEYFEAAEGSDKVPQVSFD